MSADSSDDAERLHSLPTTVDAGFTYDDEQLVLCRRHVEEFHFGQSYTAESQRARAGARGAKCNLLRSPAGRLFIDRLGERFFSLHFLVIHFSRRRLMDKEEKCLRDLRRLLRGRRGEDARENSKSLISMGTICRSLDDKCSKMISNDSEV